MSLTTLFVVIGTAISVVSFVGLCVVYFRGSADKGTMASQARLIDTRGAEIADLERRVLRVETENTSLRDQNNVLKDAVTHVEELIQLKETLDHHHSESTNAWTQILGAIKGDK